MVSPSKPHHSRVASQEHLHKCKLVKGPKPLTHFKFYLDIKKHHIENKIEKSIRKLGGSIEFFLAKKVTHFVTDKPTDRDGNLLNVCNHYLSPSPLLISQTKTPSPIPKCMLNDSNNSDERAACSRPKSRADAMVQRARTSTQPFDSKNVQCSTPQSLSPNPMQLALNWGTPIWNTDYTLKFLEKVSLALKVESQSRTVSSTKLIHNQLQQQSHKTANVKHLHGQYIKIESSQKHYRPYYQEFSSWPTINFDCNLCPFQTHSDKVVQKNKNCDNILKSDIILENKSTKGETKSSTINNVTEVTAASIPISILAKDIITNTFENTMTRKTRNKQVREAAIDTCSIKTNNDDIKPNSEKCGYCEKCRVEYDVLASHLQSKEHLNFAKNNDNYIALDNLINSGSNVENFLRINSGQMVNEMEKNGMHSPKRESMISSRVNYLSQNSLSDLNNDIDNVDSTKPHKQINGIAHHTEEVTPSKINNIREKLPKYSPPITRRSQTKNPIQVLDESNSKHRFEKCNSVTIDFRENELNFISKADNDLHTKSPKQKKTTINGKKKCSEQESNNVNDDSPVQPKRLIRAFPRYKVVDGETKVTNQRTPKHCKTNTSSKNTENTEITLKKDLLESEKGIKDPVTGLIVKFKRVRESELSKLTFEADNFMFPKREEQPTDEDRQSTSEHDGEISSEILSSEVSSLQDTLSISHNSSLNVSTTNDQFTSSGRRKKRRAQYDNFKSPIVTKQKFRASLIQSRLNSNKKIPTNGSQTSTKQLSRRAKMSTAKVTARGRKNKRQRSQLDIAVESQADNSLDDRMGENSYIGSKLLSTDYFKNLRFSFERVPSNEPWYLTFQRQDEHCERMFEYWGNTAYRKLPYELGPLPPIQADCCLLSKLTATKTTKQQKTKRSNKLIDFSAQNDGIETKLSLTPEEDAISGICNTSINTSVKPTTIPKSCEEDEHEQRPHTSTLSQLLLADSSLNSISLPSAIPNKKKTMLVDAFGQPRKSPREHASTLSILSSLVQQRRNRIKEMNGGISPEKMPSYKAAVAAAIAAQHSADMSESEDLMDECETRVQVKPTSQPDLKSTSIRRRSNQTPVFDINKTSIENNDHHQLGSGYHSMEQSDKIFRLRKGKRRQTESVSSNNESISGKSGKISELKGNGKGNKIKNVDIPKMPVIDYNDPNKIARDLDDLLSNCYLDSENYLNDIPVDCSDLILLNSTKDFVEIIESVKDGPLTYRSLQRGKKRHINKTGWPSLPRKRLPKREKNDDIESVLSDMQNCESSHSETENDLNETPLDRENDNSNNTLEKNEDDIESTKNSSLSYRIMPRRRRNNAQKIVDDIDDEKNRVLRHNRRKIRTPFCDDNAVQFIVSTSCSEKAENSDIFTVSSDSFLDTDLNNDTLTTIKSRFSADSRLSAEDERSMSDETTANNESNWNCRSSLGSNSITEEVIKPQKGFASVEESVASTTTSILEQTLKNMATRPKFIRSPTLAKETAFDLKLQPLVCVQKMSEKDLPQTHWINNISQTTTSQESEDVKPNSRANSSPRNKSSPRKLRKPRGRWYRER